VFNLDLPDSAQLYQHRAGRTARAGASGTVITLVDARETVKLAELEKKLDIQIRPLEEKNSVPKRKVKRARRNKKE